MSIQNALFGFWETIQQDDLPNHSMVLDGGQLADQWRRCSITADFWARYIALYIPTEAGPTRLQRSAMSDVLSYLLNELFENCAKFSTGPQLTVNHQDVLRNGKFSFN
ncbi:MAG: hypothetical protein R2867_27910 [Caldilineaceae bacterium]